MQQRWIVGVSFVFAKAVVIVILVLIFASLFSALGFLIRDRGRGRRVAAALTWRIGLSMALFLLLMAGFYFGIIEPHGLAPPK